MNQFGPYLTVEASSMITFAQIVLALLHQECNLVLRLYIAEVRQPLNIRSKHWG